jgi:hypothetical protein
MDVLPSAPSAAGGQGNYEKHPDREPDDEEHANDGSHHF